MYVKDSSKHTDNSGKSKARSPYEFSFPSGITISLLGKEEGEHVYTCASWTTDQISCPLLGWSPRGRPPQDGLLWYEDEEVSQKNKHRNTM